MEVDAVDVDLNDDGIWDGPFRDGQPSPRDNPNFPGDPGTIAARRRNPWLTSGVENARAFWEDFVDAYDTAGLIAPTRVHLDIEQWLTSPFNDLSAYALYAMGRSPKWTTYNIPGYPAGTTLQDLWEEVREKPGFPRMPNANSEPWKQVVPWIPTVGDGGSVFPEAAYFPTADDMNRQLGLLKSKCLEELIVFNPRDTHNGNTQVGPGYPAFERVYNQVYDPSLVSFEETWYDDTIMSVGATTGVPTNDGTPALERMTDSNDRWSASGSPRAPTPHVVTIQTVVSGSAYHHIVQRALVVADLTSPAPASPWTRCSV